MKPLNPTQQNNVSGGVNERDLVSSEHWPPYKIDPPQPLQSDNIQPAELDSEPAVR